MKRRNFLRAVGALSLPALSGFSGLRAEGNSLFTSLINPDSDRVLVIIHLFGGNDGLNTLVPLDQYRNLLDVRRQLVLPEDSLLKISSSLAFHPSMGGIKEMYDRGQMGVIQNVGYAQPNRSHFRSTDIWTTASRSDELLTTGWLGRHFDHQYPGYPEGYPNDQQPDPPAISLGNVSHPTCEGQNLNYSYSVSNPNQVTVLAPGGNTPLPDDYYGEELDYLRTTIDQSNVYGNVIQDASNEGTNAVEYPSSNRLANDLRHVARLISGGLKTKVYTVYLGGFDTHANQVRGNRTTVGAHADLLKQVSEAVSAFQEDLDNQGLSERVLGMTFSEFGRRIRSNNSFGTDHGDAAPMFFFGGCLGGNILGDNPVINRSINQGDGIPMQFDFRDVYGSVLMDWFGAKEAKIKDVLYEDFQYLPIIAGCESALPVNLLDFIVQAQEKTIALSWTTSAESDNRGFQVERSTDGINFVDIGWVSARLPNASGQHSYDFEDRSVAVNILYYYRLKQEDNSGDYEFSPIKTAKLLARGSDENLQLGLPTPNPSSVQVSIPYKAANDGTLSYLLFDISGRVVLNNSMAVVAQSSGNIEFPVSQFPTGNYTLKVMTNNGDTVQRRILIHRR